MLCLRLEDGTLIPLKPLTEGSDVSEFVPVAHLPMVMARPPSELPITQRLDLAVGRHPDVISGTFRAI